jgi:hypothetical protein
MSPQFSTQILDIMTFVGLVTEIPEIVKVATTLIPGLRSLPILGKIIPLFQAGEWNEAKVLEQMEADANKDAEKRTKLKQETNKRVIKVSDALECVEAGLNAKVGVAFLRAACSVILGGTGNAFNTLWDPIASCMLEKALGQTNARSKGTYVKKKGPGITDQEYSELISVRKGKLHPFIPE